MSDILLVRLLCSYLYHLTRWQRAWNCSYLYRLATWPRAISVILAFIVVFETAFRLHSVHGSVSPLTNCFLSVTGIRTLGFGRRRFGRLFLTIAGLFVNTYGCCIYRNSKGKTTNLLSGYITLSSLLSFFILKQQTLNDFERRKYQYLVFFSLVC